MNKFLLHTGKHAGYTKLFIAYLAISPQSLFDLVIDYHIIYSYMLLQVLFLN